MDQHNKEEIGAFIKENTTSENTNYNKVRNQYIIERDKERKKIIRDVFESMGYKVKKGGNAGKGSSKYTSGGEMEEYDLSYWKWVDAEKDEKKCTIYMQSFDRDPNGERNYHVLLDRLSIQCGEGKIVRTNIDLPLNDEKIQRLKEMVENLEK